MKCILSYIDYLPSEQMMNFDIITRGSLSVISNMDSVLLCTECRSGYTYSNNMIIVFASYSRGFTGGPLEFCGKQCTSQYESPAPLTTQRILTAF